MKDCAFDRKAQAGLRGVETSVRTVAASLRTLPLLLVAGCTMDGAPSFPIAGAYFPAWMLCALIGIVMAIATRAVFVVSGLADILPFQLFVCSAIGCGVALLVWLFWFGQ